MLKIKLTKDEFNGLSDALKPEYKLQGDVYVIDTDTPFEDTTALKNALKTEKEERKTAKARVTELEEEVTKLTARAGDAGDLEKSWQQKLDKAKADAKTSEENLRKQINTMLVDNVASGMANEISTAPNLLKGEIAKRLTVVEEDGVFVTRVLDKDGKPSATSINELKTEVLANGEYSAIIKASSASGGGASGGKAPAGGPVPFAQMSEAQKVQLFRENPAKFKQLAAEATAKK